MSPTPDVCVGVCRCAHRVSALLTRRGLSHTCLPSQIMVNNRSVGRGALWVCVCQCHFSLRTSRQPAIGRGVAKVTEQGGPAVLGWQDTDSVFAIPLSLSVWEGARLTFHEQSFQVSESLKLHNSCPSQMCRCEKSPWSSPRFLFVVLLRPHPFPPHLFMVVFVPIALFRLQSAGITGGILTPKPKQCQGAMAGKSPFSLDF